MVKVTGYSERENKKGEQFFVLEITGGMQIKKSVSGQAYFTSMSCSVPTSFTEEQCQSMIGAEIPGKIEKVECEPYSYLIPGTNDVKTLNYRYEYRDNSNEVVEENIIDDEEVM